MTRFAPQIKLSPLFGKVVPHSLESEMCVLGAMILAPDNIADASASMSADDFYSERNREVFTTIVDVYEETGTIDLAMLCSRLRASDSLKDVGGEDYVVSLASSTPASASYRHYRDDVKSFARARRVIEVCGTAIYDVYANANDTPEIANRAFERLSDILRTGGSRTPIKLHHAEKALIHRVQTGTPELWPTGIHAFDSQSGGVPRRGVWTIFGYPGGGKTTFALNAVVNIAASRAVPVRVVSFEQGAERVAATILSAESGVPVHGMLNRGVLPSEHDVDALEKAAEKHAGIDFAMFDENLDPTAIYAEVAILARSHKNGIVVVDYVQDIPPFGQFVDLTPRISESMRILARIARELGWLVVVVSQLGKDAGKRNEQPQLADGLGSSAIEQRSDFISYVWRPHQRETPPPETDPFTGGESPGRSAWRHRYYRCRVGVIKNKFGPGCCADMMFDGKTMRFRDSNATERLDWPVIE